jgi:uncharacterized membrane protein YcaP (DUF421 family)
MNIFNAFYDIFFDDYKSSAIIIELIFRTIFIYSYTLINIRLIMDKRALSQLSPFQLIIIIALGTAIGDPMVYDQTPLINCMIVITTVLLLEKAISTLMDRNDTFEKIIVGQPTLLIKDGLILSDNLRMCGLTKEELFAQLRTAGIRDIGQIEHAYLETSGQVSVVKAKDPLIIESTINK